MILLCVHANTFYGKSAKLQPQNINHASPPKIKYLLLVVVVLVVVVIYIYLFGVIVWVKLVSLERLLLVTDV